MNRSELLLKAIEIYGEEAQIRMFFEESAELTFALCKYLRGKLKDSRNILKEIEDIRIVLDQLELMFDSNGESKSMRIDVEKSFRNKMEKDLEIIELGVNIGD